MTVDELLVVGVAELVEDVVDDAVPVASPVLDDLVDCASSSNGDMTYLQGKPIIFSSQTVGTMYFVKNMHYTIVGPVTGRVSLRLSPWLCFTRT